MRSPTRNRAGFTLLTVALSLVAMIAVVGVAVDIGRMYIAKSETQLFADSASLAATLELDGTMDGLSRARTRIASNPNRWNFNTSSFTSVTTTFAKDVTGPWEEFPLTAAGYRYARAWAGVNVPIYFLSIFMPGQFAATPTGAAFIVLQPNFTTAVNAGSSAGQELKKRYKDGLFPFSPYAHNTVWPDYGLVAGQLYTLRWAANPKQNNNVCAGDNDSATIALAGAGGGSERGYIEETSGDLIRATIIGDYQTAWRGIGDTVNMTGGAKQTERDALLTRIGQDTNSTAPNYSSYVSNGTGNGRRLVGVPINNGAPDYRVVQIAAFFLQTVGNYDQGGNSPWCAEYIGAWVQGSKHKGAGDPGPYVVRMSE
jgi:hypothetical protein